jgi:hypothetical protein
MLITIEEIKERKKDQLKLIKKIACVAWQNWAIELYCKGYEQYR